MEKFEKLHSHVIDDLRKSHIDREAVNRDRLLAQLGGFRGAISPGNHFQFSSFKVHRNLNVEYNLNSCGRLHVEMVVKPEVWTCQYKRTLYRLRI